MESKIQTSMIPAPPKIHVTSHGVETARYNSLLHFHHEGQDKYAVFTCGNRLILFDFTLNVTVIDQKVMNDAIMVVVQCRQRPGRLMVCSYDAHIVILTLSQDLKQFIVEQEVLEFCERNEYRYVRHASLNGERMAFISEQGHHLSKIVVFNSA